MSLSPLYQWTGNHDLTRPLVIIKFVAFPNGTTQPDAWHSPESPEDIWHLTAQGVPQQDVQALEAALLANSHAQTLTPATTETTYASGVVAGAAGPATVTLTASDGTAITAYVERYTYKQDKGGMNAASPAYYQVTLECYIPH